jgi:excisionase family DNA binding protein
MVEEVAARLRTGRNYVYRRIEDGSLKALNIGTAARPKFRITEDQLQAFIDAQSQTSPLS